MKFRIRARVSFATVGVLVAATLAATAAAGAPAAVAAQPSDPGPSSTQLPSAVPSAITPAVNDGKVYGIAQTGSTMAIGGSFTSVGGQARHHFAAFDKNTGALSPIAPDLNGDVNAVVPGPTPGTVILGGAFTQVGSAPAQFLAEIDLTTGKLVSGFNPPAFDYGFVNDVVRRGNHLYVAGTFSRAGGKPHAGIVELDATTGAIDDSMNIQFTGHHNDSGSGAQGWIGPSNIDVTNDGKTMVVIGNFKYADGLLRDQAALIDLSGATAQVAPWATDRYSPLCFNWAFDSYVRGVSFSPDGSYFVINATGGGNPGTLCDATARFETNLTDTAAQPTWVDETGGDTTWGVTLTDTVVYVGGHNRWNNNPLGVDQAKPGAVPRPGLAALDPATGRPFSWNPGRNPLGTAVYAMLATSDGLWIGSNTDWIGNRQYKRPKIAFFPYTGGYEAASTAIAALPGTVYAAGATSTSQSNVLYRVDAGGPVVQAIDNGPDWAADSTDPSPYRNTGSNTATYSAGAAETANVPASTPNAIFNTERWSPSDNPAMRWAFAVPAGTHVEVRLYFANRCTCTSGAGQREFNVAIDNQTVLQHYDIVADVGDQTGTMKSFSITSDGTVNIDFSHYVENPLVNGIELINLDAPAPPPNSADSLKTISFDGTHASSADASNQSIDFGNWRGAFLVNDTVYYGYTDGALYSRSFDNGTFGPARKVDPYNDPYWSDVDTNDGTTFRGAVPSLYPQMPNVTGMTYYQGRLYYTLYGDSHLYSRWFLPDSGILDERTRTESSSVDFSDADGMFVASGKLYFVSKSTGNLNSVAFSGGTVSGTPTTVSGPAVDGVNWRNRALFLSGQSANQAPNAQFDSNCSDLSCTFNGSASSDPDGNVQSYSWDFGDGTASGSGVSTGHTYASPGTYTVTLTVTDDGGLQNSATSHVTVTAPPPPPASGIQFVGAAHSDGGNTKVARLTVPSAAAAGDTAVLFFTQPSAAAWSGPTGVSGWTQLDSYANGTLMTTVWTKALADADAGATVRFDSAKYAHGSAELAVYSGVNTAAPVASFAHTGDASGSSHTTPTATAGSGDYVVSFWADRAGSARTWTAPAGQATRDASPDSGSGVTVNGLVTDLGTGANAGSVGGYTATTDADTDRANMWTIVLNQPPADQGSGVAFVAAAHSDGGNRKVQTVTVPGSASVGDTAVLLFAQPSAATWAGPTGVSGWTLLDSYTNGTLVTSAWTKTVTAGDLGATVRFDSSTYAHGSAQLAIYSGVDQSAPVAAFAHSGDASGTSHTTPTVDAAAGDYVVSWWADRSASVRTWTAPAGQVVRDASPDTGSGVTVNGLVTDAGAPAAGGTVGGYTATTDAGTDRANMWTIALKSA
ncbi:MAG TPA: PKD domain-containing protein [Jatrophihabitans sp.]|nr:PKD domain-containing protein [Jatrophihabitans sp.]